MAMRSVTRALLGLTTVLVACVPVQAQEPKPSEPPAAAGTEPGGPGTRGNADLEPLDELLGRRKKTRRELHLLESQLAVKRAEAQKADAELQVFLLRHPESVASQRVVEEAIGSDPAVASLRAQIDSARGRVDAAARMARSPADPSMIAARRKVCALQEQFSELIESRKIGYLYRMPSTDIEQTLDRLIGELESLKRGLLRESPKP